MIESLSEITMRQYVDMVCGDVSVLKRSVEVVSPQKLQDLRRRLMLEYAEKADGAGTKAAVGRRDARRRTRAEVTLFKVLSNLMAMGAFDDVRSILRSYGIARQFDDSQLRAEVTRLLTRAEAADKRAAESQKDEDKAEPTAKDIRDHFDRQAASLMTFFKFQIDFNTISASQFACMVDQANREVKAKMAAIKR